jgi:hypothetical protein
VSVRPDIRLQIDRLVLDGIPLPAEQQRILRGALEGELTRLLETDGDPFRPSSGLALHRVCGPMIDPASGDPVRLGHQLARAVHQSLAGIAGTGTLGPAASRSDDRGRATDVPPESMRR